MKNKKLLVTGLIAAFALTMVSVSARGLANCNDSNQSYRQGNRNNYSTNDRGMFYSRGDSKIDCSYENTEDCPRFSQSSENQNYSSRNNNGRQGRNCSNK